MRPEIQDNRNDGDALVLSFEQLDQVPAAKLKAILAEHLRGFRETFGKGNRSDDDID